MKKPNVALIAKNVKSAAVKHSPEILTGIGIAGMVTTTVLAIRATPRALDLIARADDEKFDNGHGEHLTKFEVIKVAWKPYIPAAVTCVTSAACLIGASSVSAKRNAVLATAYKLSESALTEYREKVVETIGEKKEREVRDKISQDRVTNNPVSNNTVYITGTGDTLFLEPISKRYFEFDIERLRAIVNTLNERMYSDPFGDPISLSDFYDEINLKRTDISDDMGWHIDDGSIKLDFHPTMCDDEHSPYYNKPCLAIYYVTPPKWGYDK